ncbi:MAG TPA: type II secretion system F family protein [Thermoanaerobaculia bacterium]|jgi:type IV pilus assembly protein PilC|nr:type II secretion system F family protein [Thermoanaerobaculia bacterium]
MQFTCRLGTPEGAVIEQLHHATSADALRQDLQRKGFHVFEVRPRLGLAMALPRRRARGKLSTQRFLVFNQELAALLAAGLPLLQCLDLMLERMKEPLFREVLIDVRERVASGQELSAAFEAHAELFPRLYSSSLKAGERSGDLEKVIRRFVRYLQLMLEARKRVVSALVYPTVLVCLSAAMVVVMTVFVVPKFAGLYADLEAQLPLITRITLAIGQFVQAHWLAIVLVIAGAIFAVDRYRDTPEGQLALDHLRLRLPVLGDVFHRFGMSEYTRSLATLLDGGLPLVPSLEIATGAVGNSWLRDKLAPTVQRVREGKALHAALEQTTVVEDIAVDMVKVGETTGALAGMLTNISDFLDQEVEIRMQRLLTLVEPIMLVFMGIIVALLLISVYLPMFSILGQVK